MDTVSENITTREQWQPTRWAICDAKMSAWMFTSAIDAANALSALYAGVHAHRATVAQRELLLEMIADEHSKPA
jgi:hypothetical protein